MAAKLRSNTEVPMDTQPPKVVILAGPNGVGKSTSAAKLLLGPFHVDEFVNADAIAQGLSAFAPDRVAIEAGRVMLHRLKELAAQRASFAFETTLASRSFASWLQNLKTAGYEVHLLFLWLPNAEMAVARVAERVRAGGHDVPKATIRRRYTAGLKNLRTLYSPLANSWKVMDSTRIRSLRLIAAGKARGPAEVYLESVWRGIMEEEQRP